MSTRAACKAKRLFPGVEWMWATALIAPLLVAGACRDRIPVPEAARDARSLDLVQIASVEVPSAANTLVFSIDEKTNIVAVGPSPGPVLIASPTGDKWSVESPAANPIAVSVVDRVVRVLDRSGGVSELDLETRRVAAGLPPAVELHLGAAAASSDGFWALSIAETDTAAKLHHCDGERCRITLNLGGLLKGWDSHGVRIAAAHDAVVLYERSYPFRALRVPVATGTPLASLPSVSDWFATEGTDDLPSQTELRRWVALALVPLDHGSVQTISNTASDQRLIVRRDYDGRIAAVTRINVPLGFVTSAPAQGLLVAARNVGVPELVLYEWRWSTNGQGGVP